MKFLLITSFFCLVLSEITFTFNCETEEIIGEPIDGCVFAENQFKKEEKSVRDEYKCRKAFIAMLKNKPPFTVKDGGVNENWIYRNPGIFSIYDGTSTIINMCIVESTKSHSSLILFLDKASKFMTSHKEYFANKDPYYLLYTIDFPEMPVIESIKIYSDKYNGIYSLFYTEYIEPKFNYLFLSTTKSQDFVDNGNYDLLKAQNSIFNADCHIKFTNLYATLHGMHEYKLAKKNDKKRRHR